MNTPNETSPGNGKEKQPLSHAAIADRARELWNSNGMPAGRDEEFWLQAERELQSGLERPVADEHNAQGEIVKHDADDARNAGGSQGTATPKGDAAGSTPPTRSRDASEAPPRRSNAGSREAGRRR